MKEQTNFFEIKNSMSKDEFLRRSFIALTENRESPLDILDADFDVIKDFTREFIICKCNVHLNFSGSVGYDRQETYVDYEKKWDYDLKMEVTRPVTKTRTVTDWRPHSGDIDSEEMSYVFNGDVDEDRELTQAFPEAVKEVKAEDLQHRPDLVVNYHAQEEALDDCRRGSHYRVRWPGDHYRDESYHETVSNVDITGYSVPCYNLEFSYHGHSGSLRGYALTGMLPLVDLPSGLEEKSVQSEKDKRDAETKEKVDEKMKVRSGFKKGFIAGLIMTIVGGIVAASTLFSILLYLIQQNFIAIIPSAIFAIAGIVVLIIGAPKISPNHKKMQEIDAEISKIKADSAEAGEEEARELQNYKINKLKEMLAKHNFKELTEDEEDIIRTLNH